MKSPDDMNEEEMRQWVANNTLSEEYLTEIKEEFDKNPEDTKKKIKASADLTMEIARFHPEAMELIFKALAAHHNPVIFLKYTEYCVKAVVEGLREADAEAVEFAEVFAGKGLETFVKIKIGDFLKDILKDAKD